MKIHFVTWNQGGNCPNAQLDQLLQNCEDADMIVISTQECANSILKSSCCCCANKSAWKTLIEGEIICLKNNLTLLAETEQNAMLL